MTFDTDAINNIKFTQGFRGYDTAEVDEFLDDMIREIEKLNNNIKGLKEEVAKEKRKSQLNLQEIDRLTQMNENLSTQPTTSQVDVSAPAPVEEPKPETEHQPMRAKKPTSMEDIKGTPEYEDMKQILTDTLLSAQQHAEKMVKDAQVRSSQMVEEGERKAKDRVVSLNVEINENKEKLNAITSMVAEARQRFKKNFQDQIVALESMDIGEKLPVDKVVKEYTPAEQPQEQEILKPEMLSLDDIITEKTEEKKADAPKAEEPKIEEVKAQELEEKTPKASSDEQPEVNAFDFTKIKKSMAKEEPLTEEASGVSTSEPPMPESTPIGESPSQPKINIYDDAPNEEEENQQYIELALSAYNDNKHHNSDYPDAPKNIKINEDDDEGGIYQPENRSVLSSVIEDILNNNNDE